MESGGISNHQNSKITSRNTWNINETKKEQISTGYNKDNSISNKENTLYEKRSLEHNIELTPPSKIEEAGFKPDFKSISEMLNQDIQFKHGVITNGLIDDKSLLSEKEITSLLETMSDTEKSKVIGDLFKNDPIGFSQLDSKQLDNYVTNLNKVHEKSIDLAATTLGITHAPKEIITDLKNLNAQAYQKLLTGNVEDTLQILTEIQSKLQDSRVQFDQEAIQAHKQKMKVTHEQRIDKLYDQLEKLQEAKKWAPLIKALGAILVILGFVAAALTGGAAGALMAVGATIMAATFILNETGAMEKMCAGNKDAALAMNIALTILGIALSLGAGFIAAPKAATQLATQTVKQSAERAASAATQKALQEVAKGTSKEAINKAAQKAAEESIRNIVDNVSQQAITAGMKSGTKDLIRKSVEEAARNISAKAAKSATEQAIKGTAQKSIEQSVTKSILQNAGDIGKISAKTAAEQVRFGNFQNVANQIRNGTRIGQGVSLAMQGGLEIDSTQNRWEAAQYGVEAKELLAFLTRMQFATEVLMENIKVIYDQMQTSWEISSDTLKNAFESKQKLLNNLNPPI